MTEQRNRPGGEPGAAESLAGDTPMIPLVTAECRINIAHRFDFIGELYNSLPDPDHVHRLVLYVGNAPAGTFDRVARYLLPFTEIVIVGYGPHVGTWRANLLGALRRAAGPARPWEVDR